MSSTNDNERLHIQANGYINIDKNIINEAMNTFDNSDLIIMDLGCSDGTLTFSRFNGDDRIKQVIGIDINSENIAAANLRAHENGLGDKFHFFELDLDLPDSVSKIKDIMTGLGIEYIDIVFSALTIHFLKNAISFLHDLRSLFSVKGIIILRGSDDGTKIIYPCSELMDRIIKRYSKYSESDRFNGRKLYYQLVHAGYENITMSFETTDTSRFDKNYREAAFHIGMDFRIKKMKDLAEKHPYDKTIQRDYKWMCNAVRQLENSFYNKDFWYFLVNFIAIAEPKKDMSAKERVEG